MKVTTKYVEEVKPDQVKGKLAVDETKDKLKTKIHIDSQEKK